MSPRLSPKPKAEAFRWNGSTLWVLEQRDLPRKTRYISCRTHKQAAACIRQMSVRGAPAIGCVAAFGMVLAAREKRFHGWPEMKVSLENAARALAESRPTAVNLAWALKRMRTLWENAAFPANNDFQKHLVTILDQEARSIAREDFESCRRMGELGASLIPNNSVVLTHCNTGALATAGHGTALGVIRSAHALGKIKKVLVDETRPYLQGARLTAWELQVEGIPYEVITDSMAGHLMKTETVSAVLVGADRIAANGDTANKIGTYSLAILAKHHGLPFYVVAPFSTVDLKTSSGEHIPIEERSSQEVLFIGKIPISPTGAKARHPAFDVTPASLITAIVTDRGTARPPYAESLHALAAGDR
jgi:methylthioribose-1-phosphate isomerase